MLTAVEVDDYQGNTYTLPIDHYGNNTEIFVKEILGLDPVKANIVTSKYAKIDGVRYQASNREARNIVIKVGITPYFGNHTVEENRKTLYQHFMPKKLVKLNLYVDGGIHSFTEGVVESCETNLFVEEPEMLISILCFDPDFTAVFEVNEDGLTVDIASIGSSNHGLMDYNIWNNGDVPVGYVAYVNVDYPCSGFVLSNTRPNSSEERLTVNYDFLLYDVVEVSVMPNRKTITLFRGTEVINIMSALALNSKWGLLYPGVNHYRVECDSTIGNIWNLTYIPKFGGM